jgi:hypothetical protein
MGKSFLTIITVAFTIIFTDSLFAAPSQCDPGQKTPKLHIPYMHKTPEIDGVIGTEEWKNASRITGFMTYKQKCLLPDFLQPVWWIGWDDHNLYFAQRFALYPKGSIKAKQKKGDEGGSNASTKQMLFDDHVEIQIATVPRREDALKDHFYKLIINSYGAIDDSKREEAVGWSGSEWESHAKTGSTVTGEYWSLEVAIPWKNMGFEGAPKDLTKLYMQLVSSADPETFYTAWVPVSWMSWMSFPEIILDKNVPAIRIMRLAGLEKGNLDVALEFNNQSSTTSSLNTEVEVTDYLRKEIYQKQQSSTIAGKQDSAIDFKEKNLKIPARKISWKSIKTRNDLQLTVKNQKNQIVFSNNYNFVKIPEDFKEVFLEPFAASRRILDSPVLYSAYMPYYNKLEVFADVNLLGLAEKYKKATKVKVSIETMLRYYRQNLAKKAGLSFLEKEVDLPKSGEGHFTFQVPDLPAGQYLVTCSFLDEKGKILYTVKEAFRRYKFEWEHNNIGKTTEAIPPFEPVEITRNKNVRLWNREYVFNNTGLPQKLISNGKELLTGPIQLSGIINGKKCQLQSADKLELKQVSSGLVQAKGKALLGPLSVKVTAMTEYDGLINFDLEVIPDKETNIDDLDLVIKMPQKRAGDYYIMNVSDRWAPCYGETASKDGVFWDSGKLNAIANVKGKILPYLYLGDGDRGLCYVASSDKWRLLDYRKPGSFLEKKGNDIILRIKLVNTERKIKTPLTFSFGLQAVPVKPLAKNYRKHGFAYKAHHKSSPKITYLNGFGGGSLTCWGLGPGTDALTVRDESDYDIIRNQVLAAKRAHYPDSNIIVSKYIPTNTLGLGMKEFDTFAGEWSGRTQLKPNPIPGLLNKGSAFGFLDAKQATRQHVDLTQSMVDMRVWSFDQLQKRCGLNGFWWDHQTFWSSGNLNKQTAYRKPDGSSQGILNIFLMRQMLKRMATAAYENALPFTSGHYAPGVMPMRSFDTYVWGIEGPWYCKNDKMDILDNFQTLSRYRIASGRVFGLPVRLRNCVYDKKSTNAFQTRNAIGLALLHDCQVGAEQLNSKIANDVYKVLDQVDYFDDRTEWVPYWRSREYVKLVENSNVAATVYLNKHDHEGGKALIVLFNPGKQAVASKVKLNFPMLIKQNQGKVYDGERNTVFDGNEFSVNVPAHDYVLLVVKGLK